MTCLACQGGCHGPDCKGCACRCRAMLGLDGPFYGSDPTAPRPTDAARPGFQNP